MGTHSQTMRRLERVSKARRAGIHKSAQTRGQDACDAWNGAHPRGSVVEAYLRPECEPKRTTTRSAAWVISTGEVVVLLDGVIGGVPISLVADVIEADDEAGD